MIIFWVIQVHLKNNLFLWKKFSVVLKWIKVSLYLVQLEYEVLDNLQTEQQTNRLSSQWRHRSLPSYFQMIQAHKAICCQNLLKLNPVNCEVQSFSEWLYNSDTISTCCQGIIQKKSASGSRTLPCLVIFSKVLF